MMLKGENFQLEEKKYVVFDGSRGSTSKKDGDIFVRFKNGKMVVEKKKK